MAGRLPPLNLPPPNAQAQTPVIGTPAGQLRFPGSDSSIPFKASDLQDLGVIGKGNFGRVYKMLHKPTGKHVAVKIIRPTGEEARRFERELTTGARAQECPSIVCFLGYVFDEGSCLLCMELMNVSLDQLSIEMAKKGRKFSEKFIWMVAVDVLDGLCFLRDLKQMHRDIKPENILLNLLGRAKLCDLGLTCGLGVNSIALSLAKVGCKKYMAPERIHIIETSYGTASDVWSYGLSLVEIVTGRFPYETTNEFKFYEAVVNGAAPQLKQEDLGPDHSEEMRAFINRCLVKEVGHRPRLVTLPEHPFYMHYRNLPEQEIRDHVTAVVSELLETIPAFKDDGRRR